MRGSTKQRPSAPPELPTFEVAECSGAGDFALLQWARRGGSGTPERSLQVERPLAELFAASPALARAVAGLLAVEFSVTFGQEREVREVFVPIALAALRAALGSEAKADAAIQAAKREAAEAARSAAGRAKREAKKAAAEGEES